MDSIYSKNGPSKRKSYVLQRQRLYFVICFFAILLLFTWNLRPSFTNWFSLPKAPDALLQKINEHALRSYLEYLSSDELEGRGTGTRGEKLAVKYIETQMGAAGLETILQEVPLVGIRPEFDTDFSLVVSSQADTIRLRHRQDFVVSTETVSQELEIYLKEIVFVGFGIFAPEYNWDDFKKMDVSGKVLLTFVNEPKIPGLFKGDEELSYYGRWMYKLEEARRRKAQALILIHTEETAGYPFTVISNQEEQIRLKDGPDNPLQWRMWIAQQGAEQLTSLAGKRLSTLLQMANSKSFTPLSLRVQMQLRADFTSREFVGTNVIGILPGKLYPEEYILVSTHHDHLGVGTNTGDNIYNGAEDNASGVSALLSLVQVLGVYGQLDKSIIFLSVTAEEYGLLGAFYYAKHPVVPIQRTIANINFDIMNMHGATRDVVGLGAELSELKDIFQQAAQQEKLYVSSDPNPAAGSFFRSDTFAFARAGIPAVYVWSGRDYVGKSPTYFSSVRGEYVKERYHQPSDEYNPMWSMVGVVQQMKVALRLIYGLSQASYYPKWFRESANGFLPQ